MDIFDKYPALKKKLDMYDHQKRNEILTRMLAADREYKSLANAWADASMTLKSAIDGTEADGLFEKYSDTVYAQEVYELDAMYRQSFYDAASALNG